MRTHLQKRHWNGQRRSGDYTIVKHGEMLDSRSSSLNAMTNMRQLCRRPPCGCGSNTCAVVEFKRQLADRCPAGDAAGSRAEFHLVFMAQVRSGSAVLPPTPLLFHQHRKMCWQSRPASWN
jgi:hypothetical protein